MSFNVSVDIAGKVFSGSDVLLICRWDTLVFYKHVRWYRRCMQDKLMWTWEGSNANHRKPGKPETNFFKDLFSEYDKDNYDHGHSLILSNVSSSDACLYWCSVEIHGLPNITNAAPKALKVVGKSFYMWD